MRNTSAPASNNSLIIFGFEEEGPNVAKIFTRLLRLIDQVPLFDRPQGLLGRSV